jgi:L-threonylcarbamoyladenylate synthase
MTKILEPTLEAINEAAFSLLNDGIVIIPTIRWYMICSKAENHGCVETIFEAKKRPLNKQPLFILPDKKLTDLYFKIDNETEKLIKKLWPGELSLLLQWVDKKVASQFEMLDQTYALTCNPLGLFGEIAKTVSSPLAATTVSFSNSFEKNDLGPAISLEEVMLFIQKTGIKIDTIINGGICPTFIHTTIVDCRYTNQKPKIIREGFVHERAIKAALSTEVK